MDNLSDYYFYVPNGLLSAKFAIENNEQINKLCSEQDFQHKWEVFKLAALNYVVFNENDDCIIGIRTVNYLVDTCFSNLALKSFLKNYFNHLAVTDK